MYFGIRKFPLETLCYQLAVWLWTSLLTSLSLSLLSCQMGMYFRDVARMKSTQDRIHQGAGAETVTATVAIII